MSRSTVLVITPRFPLPLRSGTQIREYYSVLALAERFDVHLLSLTQDTVADDHLQALEERGVGFHTVPHNRSKYETLFRFPLSREPYRVTKFENDRFREICCSLISEIDPAIVWVHFLSTMPLVPPTDATVVLDQHNADLKYWDSFAKGNIGERLFAAINKRRITDLQSRVIDQVDIILSVSESDRRQTEQWADKVPVYTIPNGVDIKKFEPTTSVRSVGPEVLFVGSLDVRMNEEALEWFVRESWPTVRQKIPDARFRIVGRNPSSRVQALENTPKVTVIGEVDSVIPHYDSVAVVVAPFQFGGGTKLKVLEALAMERGLVATPKGVTGLDLVDGEHLLIRDRNGRFADAVIELLANADKRAQLGRNGRELVCQRYDWDSIMASAIDKVCEHLL